MDGFVNLVAEFKEKLEDNQLADSEFYVALTSHCKNTNSLGSYLISVFRDVQVSAGVMKSAKMPHFVLLDQHSDIPPSKTEFSVSLSLDFLAIKSQFTKKRHKEVFENLSLNMDPFVKIGENRIENCYGPYKEVFDIDPNNHNVHHKTIYKSLLNITKRQSRVFTDFQHMMMAVICCKFCPLCLRAVLKSIDDEGDALEMIALLLDGIEVPVDTVDAKVGWLWLDDNKEPYKPQLFREELMRKADEDNDELPNPEENAVSDDDHPDSDSGEALAPEQDVDFNKGSEKEKHYESVLEKLKINHTMLNSSRRSRGVSGLEMFQTIFNTNEELDIVAELIEKCPSEITEGINAQTMEKFIRYLEQKLWWIKMKKKNEEKRTRIHNILPFTPKIRAKTPQNKKKVIKNPEKRADPDYRVKNRVPHSQATPQLYEPKRGRPKKSSKKRRDVTTDSTVSSTQDPEIPTFQHVPFGAFDPGAADYLHVPEVDHEETVTSDPQPVESPPKSKKQEPIRFNALPESSNLLFESSSESSPSSPVDSAVDKNQVNSVSQEVTIPEKDSNSVDKKAPHKKLSDFVKSSKSEASSSSQAQKVQKIASALNDTEPCSSSQIPKPRALSVVLPEEYRRVPLHKSCFSRKKRAISPAENTSKRVKFENNEKHRPSSSSTTPKVSRISFAEDTLNRGDSPPIRPPKALSGNFPETHGKSIVPSSAEKTKKKSFLKSEEGSEGEKRNLKKQHRISFADKIPQSSSSSPHQRPRATSVLPDGAPYPFSSESSGKHWKNNDFSSKFEKIHKIPAFKNSSSAVDKNPCSSTQFQKPRATSVLPPAPLNKAPSAKRFIREDEPQPNRVRATSVWPSLSYESGNEPGPSDFSLKKVKTEQMEFEGRFGHLYRTSSSTHVDPADVITLD